MYSRPQRVFRAAIEVRGQESRPGSSTKPNEDFCGYQVDDQSGLIRIALLDGATDVSGIDYQEMGMDSPPRWYARHGVPVALQKMAQAHPNLRVAASETISSMRDLWSAQTDYQPDRLPHYAQPAAAGILTDIDVSEGLVKSVLLADCSLLIRNESGGMHAFHGSHNTSHLKASYDAAASDLTQGQYVREIGRNAPDRSGYGAFSLEPHAVSNYAQSVCFGLRNGANDILVATDGFMRPVNDYNLWSEADLWTKLDQGGITGVIDEIRRIEAGDTGYEGSKKSDDATALWIRVNALDVSP